MISCRKRLVIYRARKITQTYDRRKDARLIRQQWPKPEDFPGLNMSAYESVHCAPGIVQDQVWAANLPLYRRLFPADQLHELEAFRKRVTEAADEAAKRKPHYHPEQNDAYWKQTFKKENMFERR